jgi:magnesium-transporting ATPase (P-type)
MIGSPKKHAYIPSAQLAAVFDAYTVRRWNEDLAGIEALGGPETLLEMLKTSTEKGLCMKESHTARIAEYGQNFRPPPQRSTFCGLCWDTLEDLTLRILLVCGFISLVLGVTIDEHPEIGWIDGFAIILAVVIVVLVTAVNDYQK